MKCKTQWILLMLLLSVLLAGCGGTLKVRVVTTPTSARKVRLTALPARSVAVTVVSAARPRPAAVLPTPVPTLLATASATPTAPIPSTSSEPTRVPVDPSATPTVPVSQLAGAAAGGVIITTPTPALPGLALPPANDIPTEAPSPTLSVTATRTASPTASATATREPIYAPATPTFTPVPPLNATYTPSMIPTASATPTPTPSRTPTLTLTPPAMPTASVTPTESPLKVIRGPDMRVARAWHTATRLADGKILLVGGNQDGGWGLADVEIFDPVAGQTSLAAPLRTARHNHTATLLPDGRVLVVGGYSEGWLNDAEVYDPVADSWTVVPPHYSHGPYHTATLLKDGRVLVVGGGIGSCQGTERVEIFDPRVSAWTEAQSLAYNRTVHTAVLLDDGRVLVIGGWSTWKDCGSFAPDGDALLYDPQADTWTATGPMITPRQFSAPVRLPDGRVLVVGGLTYEDPAPRTWATVEIYNPALNMWTAAAGLAHARYTHALVLLPDGQVLAVGGARDADYLWHANSFVREIERYDPVANAWRTVGELPQPRAAAAITLLSDGRIWLAGGRNATTPLSDTWLLGARVESP